MRHHDVTQSRRWYGAVWSGPMVGTAVVAAAAAAAVGVAWAARPVAASALAGFTLVLGWLSAIDLRERRLPNRIVGPLALAVVAGVAVAGLVAASPWRPLGAVAVGLAFSAGLLGLSLVGSIGMGDIKLAFPIGVVAGWLGGAAVWATVMVTAVSGAVAAGVVLSAGKGRHHTLPYGPFMALGSVVGILFGARG